MNTSIDGNCGANSETNATCLDSTFGNCCSSKGFCGETSAYCSEGCQLEFGECNDARVQTVTTTGSCGATLTSNVTCLGSTYGDCCSSNGFSGGNSSHCADGCQSDFGSCGSSATTPSTTPILSAIPSPEPGSGGLSKGAIAGISKRSSAPPGAQSEDTLKEEVPVRHEMYAKQMSEMEATALVRPPAELAVSN